MWRHQIYCVVSYHLFLDTDQVSSVSKWLLQSCAHKPCSSCPLLWLSSMVSPTLHLWEVYPLHVKHSTIQINISHVLIHPRPYHSPVSMMTIVTVLMAQMNQALLLVHIWPIIVPMQGTVPKISSLPVSMMVFVVSTHLHHRVFVHFFNTVLFYQRKVIK